MKHIYIFQVVAQVCSLIRPENAKGEGKNRPEMNDLIIPAIVVRQFMNLGMAVVTAGDAVLGTALLDLLILQLSIFKSLIFEA